MAVELPILGVRAVTAEYSTGMIRLTLRATPRRERVLLAKVAVVAGLTLPVASIATAGMFLAAQMVWA